jgi:hypothetical protein
MGGSRGPWNRAGASGADLEFGVLSDVRFSFPRRIIYTKQQSPSTFSPKINMLGCLLNQTDSGSRLTAHVLCTCRRGGGADDPAAGGGERRADFVSGAGGGADGAPRLCAAARARQGARGASPRQRARAGSTSDVS